MTNFRVLDASEFPVAGLLRALLDHEDRADIGPPIPSIKPNRTLAEVWAEQDAKSGNRFFPIVEPGQSVGLRAPVSLDATSKNPSPAPESAQTARTESLEHKRPENKGFEPKSAPVSLDRKPKQPPAPPGSAKTVLTVVAARWVYCRECDIKVISSQPFPRCTRCRDFMLAIPKW